MWIRWIRIRWIQICNTAFKYEMFWQVLEDNDYGRAVDWWGVGVVMYEMMVSTEHLFRIRILGNDSDLF
jgi:hypothetical protein